MKISFRNTLTTTEKWALAFVFFATTVLLLQHWGMTLSNSDDPWIIRASLSQIFESASAQGRFWLIPIDLLAQFPYRWGSWEIANTIKITVNALVFVLFVLFCVRLTNRLTGMLIGLVWLALIDVSPGYYSAFHGYLMMFNLQLAVLFASFVWYLKVLDAEHPRRLVLGPYLLFAFASLAYEPMLFYAGVYPALALHRLAQRGELPVGRDKWRDFVVQYARRNWVLSACIVLYVFAYFLYRHFQPTSGRGLDAGGGFLEIVQTIYRFSVNGLHVQVKPFTNFVQDVSTQENQYLAIAYALSIGVACMLILPQVRQDKKTSVLYGRVALLVLLFYVFCPNLLHGFVESYRRWAEQDPHYVGNYFSSFPLAIVLTLGLLHLVGGRRAAQEKILFVLVLVLLMTSACDNYVRWSNLAQANRRDSQLWLQAIQEMRTMPFDRLQTSIVCGVNSPEKVSGDDRYWSGYLSEILQTPIEFKSSALDTVQCLHRIDFNKFRFGVARS